MLLRFHSCRLALGFTEKGCSLHFVSSSKECYYRPRQRKRGGRRGCRSFSPLTSLCGGGGGTAPTPHFCSTINKQESDSCFILQTTPDILARLVQTVFRGCRMSYLILLVIQILLSFVGRGFTINNASKEKIEPFYETAADEGEVGGGGGVELIKMECPILFSAPLLFISPCCRLPIKFYLNVKEEC